MASQSQARAWVCLWVGVCALVLADGVEAGAPGSPFDYIRMNDPAEARRIRRQGGPGIPKSSSKHAAAMVNDVALTTVAVSDEDKAQGGRFDQAAFAGAGGVGENIYGPFEAGFSGSGKQANILKGKGCIDPSQVELPGGVDTAAAEVIMNGQCDQSLTALLDECGGHTKQYHNHEKLICLYNEKAEGHSTKVGEALDGTPIYGKYEEVVNGVHIEPLLDACGGHFGVTPDSDGQSVYHYHVQDKAPFIIGCFGPNDDDSLVTVQQCRDFYTGCGDDDGTGISSSFDNLFKTNGAGKGTSFTLKDGSTLVYDLWCPCFDAEGKNIGTIKELPVFDQAPGATDAPTVAPKDTTPAPQPATTQAAATNPPLPAGKTKPNVVLFMPDDLPFYWEESPQDPKGKKDYAAIVGMMPHLQQLRDEGVVFTKAYTSGPKCAPSRLGMLTGRYPSRSLYAIGRTSSDYTRVAVNVPGSKLDTTDLKATLQAELSTAGVVTIQSGKWHISPESRAVPLFTDYAGTVQHVESTGFDHAVGVYQGNFDPKKGAGGYDFSHNPEWMYTTSAKEVEDAVNNGGKQFFLYFAPTAPHSPSVIDALALDVKITPAGDVAGNVWTGKSRSEMLASSTNAIQVGAVVVDEQLGTIRSKLDTLGVLDNTMIIFTMDHGQIAKDSVYEGGTRVMLVARYPGVFPAKTVISDYAVSNLDIAPTILQAFGVEASIGQDGVSWFDTARGLANAALEARQCIVSEIDLQRSVVCGDHKLISNLEADTTRNYAASADVVQLYDLAKDPMEQSNVAADTAYAGVLARLQEYLACHDKDTAKSGATSCDTGALNPLERATFKPAATDATTAGTGAAGTAAVPGANTATAAPSSVVLTSIDVSLPMPAGVCEKQTAAEITANVGVVAAATGQAAQFDLAESTGSCEAAAGSPVVAQATNKATTKAAGATDAPTAAPKDTMPASTASTAPAPAAKCVTPRKNACTGKNDGDTCTFSAKGGANAGTDITGTCANACCGNGRRVRRATKDNFAVRLTFKAQVAQKKKVIAAAVKATNDIIKAGSFSVSLVVDGATVVVKLPTTALVTEGTRVKDTTAVVKDTTATAAPGNDTSTQPNATTSAGDATTGDATTGGTTTLAGGVDGAAACTRAGFVVLVAAAFALAV